MTLRVRWTSRSPSHALAMPKPTSVLSLASDELHVETFVTDRLETGLDTLAATRQTKPSPAIQVTPSVAFQHARKPIQRDRFAYANRGVRTVHLAYDPLSNISAPSSRPFPTATTPNDEKRPMTTEKIAFEPEHPESNLFSQFGKLSVLTQVHSTGSKREF